MQNFSTMDLLWREGRGRRDTRAEQAESPEARGFPELSSPISTGFLESRDDRIQKQTHCSNKCLLTPGSTVLSGNVQEVDVCILIHGSRKVERHQEKTLCTPWVSCLNHDDVQQLHVHSKSPWKEPRPYFTQAHPVSRVCVLMSTRNLRGGGAA